MKISRRSIRIISVVSILSVVLIWLIISPKSYEQEIAHLENSNTSNDTNAQQVDGKTASNEQKNPLGASIDEVENVKTAQSFLGKLEIKGRAPKTGYARTEFYKNWPNINGCSLRQVIIKRELGESAVMDGCDVVGGNFVEPYTGNTMNFYQKSDLSKKIQIDHIVALSDAWQKGAQYKTKEERFAMATDPLNLIAVDSAANQQKSDGDAATWLPPNKVFRCQYVARQISVKYKYGLWVTQAEHDAMNKVLEACPNEPVVGI